MKIQNSLQRLFISQTRTKLINVLFYNPKEIFYVRQLVRMVDEEINSVRRELDNLKKSGLVSSEQRGNRLYYCVDKNSPLFFDLLLIANQSFGLGLKLRNKNETLGTIKLVFYSYKFMVGERRSPDDVDLIIVGDVSLREIENYIKQEESTRGYEINYMVMGKGEFNLRRQKRDQFIVDFFLSNPVAIIGGYNEISNL